ncbi:RNA polymerase sigma-70 factor (ECF subfamily) [Actimicrobium sp. GrIS 1.19]|uniref:sigma-70 family RNA polymerase sigma factor n=1 Tax=Actimicrobium sp. GrIS 1.19 TaxID=3071708 RepID=UPI002E069D4E|nr:RNA polymerase sigma-70 factor (ECF subfamily) [Actimicrobium sp. GrIS 1.19]
MENNEAVDCAEKHASEAINAPCQNQPGGQRSLDHLLIQRFNAGDIRAFEVLVIKYQRRVASLINMNVHNASVAEELTQEVFLRAYRGLVNFRFESAFSTWLYRIARNISTSYYREGHMHADNAVSIDVLAETSNPIYAPGAENFAPSPEDSLCGQQLLFAIEQSIDRLSPQMRSSITMREMDHCSYAEIADTLHIPLNTVRSLIFRARATIATDIRPLLDRAISAR